MCRIPGGPKMGKNGQKWPAKMGNQDFWILHHRIITTLIFSKYFVTIEPIGENILAGQEFFLPPEPESCQFLKKNIVLV